MEGYPVPNAKYIRCIRVPLVVGAAVQLPHLEVPDDMRLNIKADPNNPPASFVFIGESRSAAIQINQSWPLAVNEAIAFRVQNADQLYASATAVPAWVVIAAERYQR